MSMRKDLGRSRALRPSAESLEVRQLLSATVSGTDTAGDHWTLTLLGKGTLQVIKQDDSSGNPGALDSATEIDSITVAGTDPRSTRLIGKVTKAAGSDGRVFFDKLNEVPNRSDIQAQGLGMLAVNMPDFWLGYTGSATAATGSPVAAINIPDGVNSLRFGGVDATKSFTTNASSSPTQDGQNDEFLVNLGLPIVIGTSIVVDKVVSASQAGTTSGTTTNPATQKSVVFNVAGRINLFEANEIDGSTTNAPALNSFAGGTIVSSFSDPASGITGELGFVRIGGNATNLSVVTNNTLANLYIGGETNNVSILTPNGSRNFYFGKGFDTSSILTNSLENLYANRGMVNSTITSSRMIGDLMLGGDVINSTVLSGYQQGLTTATTGLNSVASSEIQSNLGAALDHDPPHGPEHRRPRGPGRRPDHRVHRRQGHQLDLRRLRSAHLAGPGPHGADLRQCGRCPPATGHDHRPGGRLDRQLDGDAGLPQAGVLCPYRQPDPRRGRASPRRRAPLAPADHPDHPPRHPQGVPGLGIDEIHDDQDHDPHHGHQQPGTGAERQAGRDYLDHRPQRHGQGPLDGQEDHQEVSRVRPSPLLTGSAILSSSPLPLGEGPG